MLTPPLKKVVKWYERIPKSVQEFVGLQSQGFGSRPEVYAQFGLKGHNGLDWGCYVGTPVYASHDGVADCQIDSSAGLGVVLKGDGFKTIYWHLSEYGVSDGQPVKQGDILGLSGNTGFSTGPHLHYGLKFLNSNGTVKDYDNGYKGAVDATPHLVWWSDEQPMNEEVVVNLYRLAFYRMPTEDELTYWVGKPTADFLEVAIADRAKFLSE